jgi:hypothetical protein
MGNRAEESFEEGEERLQAKTRHRERLEHQESKVLERAASTRRFETELKLKQDKDSLEGELEELRMALIQTQEKASEGNRAMVDAHLSSEQIIGKIKKKYEKKLQQAKLELEDTKDEFYNEQQLLLESLMEQRRDMRLLELICETVLQPSELKNVSYSCICY